MSPTKKLFVSLFIFLNLLAMIRVHLPFRHKFLTDIYRPVDAYLSFMSIFQSWRMFSPNPTRTSAFITAEIKFLDGSSETYMIPRNSDLDFTDRYQFGERFRVLTEFIRKEEGKFLWKDVARYALRQVKDKNFHKIPFKVDLIEHWHMIPDMDKNFVPHLTHNESYQKQKFYTYEVL